jgi:uncharacterized protein DUF1876
MEHVAKWNIDVNLFEHEDSTVAHVVLKTKTTVLRAEGRARRNPVDAPVPEIGDELAVGRALAELGAQLMYAAAGDLAAMGQRHDDN